MSDKRYYLSNFTKDQLAEMCATEDARTDGRVHLTYVLQAENDKLRELVRDMNECLEHCKLVCKHCKFQGVDCQWFKFIDRMCELGIEVDG